MNNDRRSTPNGVVARPDEQETSNFQGVGSNPIYPSKAKTAAFNAWKLSLVELQKFRTAKLRDYGMYETAESVWNKLPQDSKDYWQQRTTYTA
jgi:hypothetical protein